MGEKIKRIKKKKTALSPLRSFVVKPGRNFKRQINENIIKWRF